LIIYEEAGDGSLGSMRVILAVCCFDLPLADALNLGAYRFDISLIIIWIALLSTLLNLILFEPLQSLDVFKLVLMLLNVLADLFCVSFFVGCDTVVIRLLDLYW
jgi:hypothetical protein